MTCMTELSERYGISSPSFLSEVIHSGRDDTRYLPTESWNSLLIKDSVESLEDCEEVDILAKGGGGGIDFLTEGEGEGIIL